MLRSLYSGISGLRSHQAMLDVTGNNIANVNTTGFKASAVQFQDTLSQMTQGGSAGTDSAGSTNAAQIGLGVKVAGVSTNFAQGAGQATGRASDLMISGDGLFAVQSAGETVYTRSGALDFDSLGRLVTTDGAFVQGWTATDGVLNEGGAVGTISLPVKSISEAKTTGSITIGGNLPADAAVGTEIKRDIEVFDGVGASTTITLIFTKPTSSNAWTVTSPEGKVQQTDSAGNVLPASVDFDPTTGKLSSTGLFSLDRSTGTDINLNFSSLTGSAKLKTMEVINQDGRAAGTLSTYSIGADGVITGSYSNGATEPIARIALATFANAGGLEKAGGSTYRATAASGTVTLGKPSSAGFGTLAGGYLEMSNVDLSQEFTNLIVAQRGFQANARIITTSDSVLEELTNLKR